MLNFQQYQLLWYIAVILAIPPNSILYSMYILRCVYWPHMSSCIRHWKTLWPLACMRYKIINNDGLLKQFTYQLNLYNLYLHTSEQNILCQLPALTCTHPSTIQCYILIVLAPKAHQCTISRNILLIVMHMRFRTLYCSWCFCNTDTPGIKPVPYKHVLLIKLCKPHGK